MNLKGYRLSEIHMFKMKNVKFLFDVSTLNLYEIDDNCYSFIENFTCEDEKIEVGDSELINSLIEIGILKTSETDTVFEENKKTFEERQFEINNIVLEMSNDCNLNCKYCYGDGGTYGRKREFMSFETAKKVIDMFTNNKVTTRKFGITFFGGEPLMNFTVMKQIVEYCKGIYERNNIEFSFSMTTNGTILTDEIYNFIIKNNIFITISIDGDKEIHDSYRKTINGKGSFDIINPNLNRLVNGKVRMNARATICHSNTEVSYIYEQILKQGFKSIAMSIADVDRNSELYITNDDYCTLFEEHKKIADKYIEAIKNNRLYPYVIFDEIISRVFLKNSKVFSCGAGKGLLAVGTNGELYPCQRFMGMESYVLGAIDEGIFDEKRRVFTNFNIFNLKECNHCWIKNFCAGGCLHRNVKAQNSIEKPPENLCNYYKKIYELVLYIYWELKQWDEDIFRKRFKNYENEKIIKEIYL